MEIPKPSKSHTKCVVIQNGSHSTIAGFSNVSQPQCVIPSSYICKKNKITNDQEYIFETFKILDECEENLQNNLNDSIEKNVYTLYDNNGLPYNWEGIAKQWEYIYKEQLKCDMTEYPLLALMPVIGKDKKELEKQIKEEYYKLAFEKFRIPILYLIPSPLAIAFSLGKKSALVVDIGAKTCQVTPILDGTIIKDAVMKSKFAGDFLDYQIMKKLNLIETSTDANNKIDSLKIWLQSNTTILDFKRQFVQVTDRKLQEYQRYYEDMNTNMMLGGTNDTNSGLNQEKYFLYRDPVTKNRKTIALKLKECYALGELLFDPLPGLNGTNELDNNNNNNSNHNNTKKDIEGLGILMAKSIKKASVVNTSTMGISGNDKDGVHLSNSNSNNNNSSVASATIVKNNISTLLDNVIITGCTSLLQGVEQRIINEISIAFPQYKITTYANNMLNDRRFQSWNGGVNMCNLPSWNLGEWITRDEYFASKETE
ncbi:hypothetical protein TBLA_0F00450 [Henningerozyma blattae CBS 6284]|uniref:Uncharacterized protein n=1 Tax=Henningerozyma blattae (strain ATCC 34711 / CBS 6284 / DSM 70876 / NBRC 10599 / NRRL Y-10934 / UCD 77-7) TaxID=1071380 RepID=I2H5D7_HENB6|nr:hypothetical protein TBLA_0F00450 [Tetrapisispora blattae CBS 6284]CCH61589.1 hypothetical protein TBLA_0F00450 [Tetrapisispora blattae CBS 6284]